jgi:FKBP-type peptidyl-prolyl cis-trans isomerase
MKKTVFLAVAVVLSACFSFSYAKNKKPVKVEPVKTTLVTEGDSLSYALGVNIGFSIQQQMQGFPGEKPIAEILIKGFTDAFKGEPEADMPIHGNQEAIAFLEKYFAKAQEKAGSENKEAGEKFLAENLKRTGISTTESGLQYEIVVDGTGEKPLASDKVTVHYRGTLIDGTEFDSSYSRNEPATFGVTQVIPGWTEALQLMKVGSKWKIYLPYTIAYGERGAGQQIKPYSALIFEVELLGIEKSDIPAE